MGTEHAETGSGAVPDDPALPQLHLALDVRGMEALLPQAEAPWRIAYLRYKPSTSCIVLYESLERTRPRWIYAKVFAEQPGSRLAARTRLCTVFPEHRLALVSFPGDLGMPGLGLAMATGESEEVLGRVLHGWRTGAVQVCGAWDPIRYKPERRCVVRGAYVSNGGEPCRFYARFYAGTEGARTSQWHRHFSGLPREILRVPRRIGYSASYRVLGIEEVRGAPLRDTLAGPPEKLRQALSATARALVLFHRLTPPAGAPPAQTAELHRAALSVDGLLRDPTRPAAELNRALLRSQPRAPVPGLIHGDFSPDQVLLRNQRVRLLDLDRLAVGDPTEDVANFHAHVLAAACRGELDAERAAFICRAFTDGYETAAGEPLARDRLNWRLSACLLKLADLPFRRFDPEWPARVRALLTAAYRAREGAC